MCVCDYNPHRCGIIFKEIELKIFYLHNVYLISVKIGIFYTKNNRISDFSKLYSSREPPICLTIVKWQPNSLTDTQKVLSKDTKLKKTDFFDRTRNPFVSKIVAVF